MNQTLGPTQQKRRRELDSELVGKNQGLRTKNQEPNNSNLKSQISNLKSQIKMPLIEITNVTKRYYKGDETITPLDAVSLNIEQSEFISLMGASGTGKSTLLNLVASIDRPDSGSIVIDGTDITRLSRSKLANWRAANMGYIFQTHNLVPVLTAYENIELPLLLLSMSRSDRRKRVEIAMSAVDLLDRADHYPRQLSGGQEQRVGIARAIVAHPKVVVADEPTGDLDADTSLQILNLLRRLRDQLNVTILMVTHDGDAAAIADKQFQLDHGKLRQMARGNNQANQVASAMGIPQPSTSQPS